MGGQSKKLTILTFWIWEGGWDDVLGGFFGILKVGEGIRVRFFLS
jgi:hypothetical protein